MKNNIVPLLVTGFTLLFIGGLVTLWIIKSESEYIAPVRLIPVVTPASNYQVSDDKLDTASLIARKEQIDPNDPYIKINEEPREVEFCSVRYLSKQIVVNGVDVIQRIAEINKDLVGEYHDHICEIIEDNQMYGNLRINLKNAVSGPGEQKEPIEVHKGVYVLEFEPGKFGPYSFSISVERNIIAEPGAYDDYAVGTLVK